METKALEQYSTAELWNEIIKRKDFIGGKLWTFDDIEEHLRQNKSYFEGEYGKFEITDELVSEIADHIYSDALEDSTDAEWNEIDHACTEVLGEMYPKGGDYD